MILSTLLNFRRMCTPITLTAMLRTYMISMTGIVQHAMTDDSSACILIVPRQFIVLEMSSVVCFSMTAGPPSGVRDLRVTYRNQSTVHLQWQAPLFVGGRTDLRYRVECQGCDSSVTYNPRRTNFNSTRQLMHCTT